MSERGHLVCRTCKVRDHLGKWRWGDDKVGYGFMLMTHTPEQNGLKALNFLAQHMNHDVRVMSSWKLEEDGEAEEYPIVSDQLSTTWPQDHENDG